MKKLFFLLCLCIGRSSYAQDTQKPEGKKDPVQLSAAQWKLVEGIFQSVDNKEQYVQFSAKDNQLVAKLLWNNGELHFQPESELAFTSKEAEERGPIHIVFHKDSTGITDQVDVTGIGRWKRTTNYKPIVKTEMPHTPGQLIPFEGLYQLQNNEPRFIQFSVKENKLILKQTWDGNEIPFLPESELAFYTPAIPVFSLEFTKEKDGSISKVLAFKRDTWVKTSKPVLAESVLKIYEGKYRSKDDPDNQVQIKAGNNSLVVKQLWDGKEIIVSPWTESYFYNDAQSYPLQIVKDKDGKFKGLQLLDMNFFERVPG